MLDATWDQETDAYYFAQGRQWPVAKTIDLGTRHVLLDIDPYGHIQGVEVL